MMSFLVFSGVAFISVIFLLSLSLRHSVNNMISWLGSILLVVAAVINTTHSQGYWTLIANLSFGVGLILYLAGIYIIAERFIGKSNSQSNNIQSKTIGDILEVAASRESLMELLNYSLDRFLEIFSLNSGAIHIFHAKKNKLVMGSYRGLIPSHAKNMEILEPGTTAIGRAVQNQRVLIIRDLSVSPDYNFFGGKSEGYTFLAVAPIMVDSKCWGVITLMGRRKYQKGIFTIDQLEQYGQKLGKALVLGRENRRMSAAYNHINHIIDYYNSIFAYLKESTVNKADWNENQLLGTLRQFKAQLFDSKVFAVIKYTKSSGDCLFIQNQNQAVQVNYPVQTGSNYSHKIPEKFAPGEYFSIDRTELDGIIPTNIFGSNKLAAYGYQYDDEYKGMVVIDNCSLKEMPVYRESILIIGNLLSLSYIRSRFDNQSSFSEKHVDDADSDTLKDLSSILTEISGNIQVLNDKFMHNDQGEQIDNIHKWLDEIEESTLNGLKLLGHSKNINNPNDLIQSVINANNTNVAFYPGLRMPTIKINPEEFKLAVDQIITEAIIENKRIRLKTTPGDNGTISLSIEGPVNQDFPSPSTLIISRDKNIVLDVKRDAEPDSSDLVEVDLNQDTAKLNVLTIEDKPVISDLLSIFLEKLGCDNHTVSTGKMGLAYMEKQLSDNNKINVVIIDMTLEDISGLELCRKIKKMDSLMFTILISSWGVNLNQYTLDDAGVDTLLQKPFSLEQLQNVLPKKDLSDAPKN